MRWIFDLTCEADSDQAKVNFQRGEGVLLLHLVRRGRGLLAANRRMQGEWGREIELPLPAEQPATIAVTVETTLDGRVLARCGGATTPIDWVAGEDLERARIWFEGAARHGEAPGDAAQPDPETAGLGLWRLAAEGSGQPAPTATLARRQAAGDFRRGLSVIVRARDAAATVQACLEGLAGLADEILLVDCGSGDGTLLIAERLKARIFELRTFVWTRVVPETPEAQARELRRGGSGTAAHFRNWCLGLAGCGNVLLWEADWIPMRAALSDMIGTWNLRTREDGFALWFTGLRLHPHGSGLVAAADMAAPAFGAVSVRAGAVFVNRPDGAEIDRRALHRAQKFAHPAPVWTAAAPAATGRTPAAPPEGAVEVRGADDHRLAELALPAAALAAGQALLDGFRRRPALAETATLRAWPAPDEPEPELAVLVMSSEAELARQEVIRASWGADLTRLGIPWYFVIGRPAEPARILGDTLVVGAPDSPEFAGARLAAALEYSLNSMNVDHVLRLDDAAVLDAYRLAAAQPVTAEFAAGALATAADMALDRHAGRCANPQLDLVPVAVDASVPFAAGRYGFLLGRKARAMLVREKAALRAALYEDHGVARILAARGLALEVPLAGLRCEDWREDAAPGAGTLLVAAVPDAETMEAVYDSFVGHDAASRWAGRFAERFTVVWDPVEAPAPRMRTAAV
jgi:hypothetical protein